MSGTVKLVVCKVCPVAGENCTIASVSSRVFEYPVIVTVRLDELAVTVTALTTGAAGSIWMFCVIPAGTARVTPPACQLTVSVIVPATVPVCNEKGTGAVLLAGIVKLAVSPPVENWIDGSPDGALNDASA